MKNNIYKIIVFILYVVSLFLVLFCTRIKSISNIQFNTNFRLILIFISCILIYINSLILIKKLKYSKKILRIHLFLYFLIYTITICSLTLFEEIYGRQGFILIEWDKALLNSYLKNSFNIIPFYTIRLFTNGYINGIVNFKNFGVNIIGNLIAFMPYGIFLPLIFKKLNKYYKFLIVMIIIVVIIELLQFITMSGSCDIDDLILNVFGASIIYLLFKIKFINKFMKKMFLWE